MITIRKLKTLKIDTQKRKSAVLLQDFEHRINNAQSIDRAYLKQLVEIIMDVFENNYEISQKGLKLNQGIENLSKKDIFQRINSLRHTILKELGSEPADWDFTFSRSPTNKERNKEGLENAEFNIFLDDIRSPFNVGSIFRTAEAFGVNHIFLSPDCPTPEHHRVRRTSMGADNLIGWSVVQHETCFNRALREKTPIFALETGGCSLNSFIFPKKGLAIIGSEELGISPLSRAAATKSLGLLTIPIYGKKGSLNVSSSFAIMMHSWGSKL